MIKLEGKFATVGTGLLGGIAAYMSLPIVYGWQHDPSLRFGSVCFLLWCAAVCVHWSLRSERWTLGQGATLGVASLFLFLGIVGELQALIYLAFAGYLCLPIRPWFGRMCCIGMSVFWMPAWAWLSSSMFQTQTANCSLALAIIALMISLLIKVRPFKT